ncbi:hypothetical protein HNP77_002352 [Treponema rectale]|uniref:Polymorphic outer membrane protein repeat-containing protein n=1 Tax=Treponema rectale TaxID=744512 RepID=A0A840SKH3_9SPIR|nr:hypothetical protein [Treponema rectale]MBB5219963.1 hypothetical protein [Treponema rectale]
MKKRTLFTKPTLLCVGLLFFASCSDLLGFQEGTSSTRNCGNGKVIFNGSICVTGALPVSLNETLNQVQGDSHAELDSASLAQEIPCQARNDSSVSRSALPSFIIGPEYYYYVTATQTDGSGSFTINSIEDLDFFDFSSGVTFALSLGSGTWQIISGVKRSPTFSSVNANTDPIIMSDTYPATLSAANPVVSHTFYPKPSQSGSGLVGLSMTIPTTVELVTAICSNSNWRDNISVNVAGISVTVMTKDMTSGGSTPSGSYEVTFNFFDEYGILLYSTVQTINVFDNMTTNTWLSDGSGVISDSGEFSLTADLVSQFARTTFYVGQTAAATSVEVTASDITGSGSPYAPFETVTKAVEVIAATGDSSKDYRIFVSGTVTGSQEISDAVNGKANSITIAGLNGLDSSGEPKDALSCSGSTDAVTLKVFSTVPVNLKNIKLLGDSTPTSKTMVLVLDNNYETDVTIEEGVWITGNDTSSFTEETFSAVFVGVDGKLTMKGGKISGNKCMSGGGIVVGGTFVMTGGEISGNEATASGGGVFNTGIFTFSGGKVSGNTSSSVGSGISNQGTLNMSGDAFVAGDIYLAGEENKITLTGALTAHSASDQIAITPSEWKRGTTVVQADGTNLSTIKKDGEYDYTNYFALSDDDWGIKLSSDKDKLLLDAPIYVAGSESHPFCGVAGNDTNGNGTKSKPFATIAKAIEVMNYSTAEYTIYIDGTVTGTQTISGNLKSDGNGTYNARSVTLSGATGNTSDILDGNSQGTTLTISTAVPVTIKNLKITGGSGTYGGGIYMASGSNVTLSEATVTKNESKSYGGGIAVVCATLTIDKSSITENKTIKEDKGVGGGIAIVGDETVTDTVTAKVTMKAGSVISGNSLYPNKNGGGVALYIGKTQFTMEGGEISGNQAYSGGGVSMWNDAEFIFKDGKISGNTATHSTGIVGGGGIYFCGKASLVMSGGEISGNKAKDYGGGVAFADNETTQSFTMTGGVIKNNTLTSISGLGKGIFVNGTFNMSGNALVDSTNDVYLTSEKTITITDSLSELETDNVISITPNSYEAGRTLLEAGTGTIVNLADEVGKFALTPDASDPTAGWFITSDGTLGIPLDAALVTSENYDTVTRIKVISAAGMNQIAALTNDGKNFEGKTITLFDDVTLTSSFTPIGPDYNNVFKGTFDGNNKTVSGLSGQNALFNYVDGGTVKDLTVEGSSTYAGIVNRLNSGRIEGCRSYVSVTHTGGSDTGGIAAFCNTGTIINCVNYGTVISKGDGLGGILGYQQGSGVVDSCVNMGAVQSTGATKTGGIAGLAFGIVRNCINIGEVSASTAVVGGIAGNEHCASTDRGVLNCANLAPVSGTYCVGGIAGVCDLSSDYKAIVKNCFNSGSVTITDSTKTSAGGVIGEILTGGSGTCIFVSNYYAAGTAAGGIGADNGVTVADPSEGIPSIYQMNEWVNANNSGELYKTWTSKVVDGVTLPVPDVGYDW